MQRWTNDTWKSTLHRVVTTDTDDDNRTGDGEEKKRFKSGRSIVFFVNMNGNATIVPLMTCVDKGHPSRYAPIKASEHLIQRHQSMMAKDAK